MTHTTLRSLALASMTLIALAGAVGCSDDASSTDDTEPDATTPADTNTDGGATDPDAGPMDTDNQTDTSGQADTGEEGDSGTEEDIVQDMYTADPDGGSGDTGSRGGGPSSHIDQVTFRQSESESPNGCCRDFDGDNQDDSALGDLIEGLKETTGFSLSDISMSTNANISAGDLVFLLEFGPSWSDVMNDSGFYVYAHTGVPKSTPWDTDSDSVPEFQIDPSSLDSNGQPKSSFSSVSVSQSELTADNGRMFFNLRFGSTGIQSGFTVYEAKMTGDVDGPNTTLGTDGEVSLANGEISGVVSDDDLFTAINKIQAQQCSCLNGQDMFGNGGSGQYTCQNTCSNSDNFECGSIGCSASQGIIYNTADADIDNSGQTDDFTFGMEFTAQGADITGVGSP
jgi:hypothetical protein